MIPTDKYKKGILALSRKAAEINPQLGEYQKHYLTKNAMFVVQLSNGQLEIDIELAREYEQGPGAYTSGKLRRIVFLSSEAEETQKCSPTVNTAWRRLFSQRRR